MLHVSEPDLSGREEEFVLEALRSTRISSTGPFVDRFEKEFAQLCCRQHAISVCNGTAALHLAMLGLDVRPGDEVIVPSLSFVATANAVRYVGAEPVFVDVDPDTWCISPSTIERAITPRTRGIIAVHLYGHPAPMPEIAELAQCHGLWLVEDAAEAHGALIGSKPVGSFGRVSTFSFYGNKILSCGEGGVVLVDDDHLNSLMRLVRGQGMYPKGPDARRYWHPIVGHNFRLTNVACAILCAQLERFAEMLGVRLRLAMQYRDRLQNRFSIQIRRDRPPGCAVPWVQPIVLRNPELRQAVEVRLRDNDIETRPFFYPLHQLPPYRRGSFKTLLTTLTLSERGLCLPLHTRMTVSDVDRVCDLLEGVS